MRRALLALVTLLCFMPWTRPSSGASAGTELVEPALARFLARGDDALRTYRAVRHMEAHNDRFNLSGTIDVLTTLQPDGRFTFSIVKESGSEYIRGRVLRPVLENEEKLFATTDPSRAALTASNYELAPGDVPEPGVVRLLARPRRREVSLVDGSLFVTSRDADLLRVEGRLAKNPSFWTTRVDLVRTYGRVGGMRVPVHLDTVAQIRFAGRSTMSVDYRYESINGVDVTE